MKLKYQKTIENSIYILKSVLTRNIEYTKDGGDTYKSINMYYDEKDKDVAFYLYGMNRGDNIELQSILPSASMKLETVDVIGDFNLQKALRIKSNNELQYTPVLAEVFFNVTYFASKKSTLLNILEQLLVLFDPEFVVDVTYDNNMKISTNIVMTSKSIDISDETSEEDEEIYFIECQFKITPIIIHKVKKPIEDIIIKSEIVHI